MTAGSYCYIGPQGIVHGTTVYNNQKKIKEMEEKVCLFPADFVKRGSQIPRA